MCSCLCTWGDYTFKQWEQSSTSCLCNYKRIRLRSQCKDLFYILSTVILSVWARALVLSLLVSLHGYKQEKRGQGVEGQRTYRRFYFTFMELHPVKVITGCRQKDERRRELITPAKRRSCIDPRCFSPSAAPAHSQSAASLTKKHQLWLCVCNVHQTHWISKRPNPG